jgi:putative ABC transport system substrate-binding protein
VRRIGVLMGFAESDSEGQAFIAAFREGLQKLGWLKGGNTRIDARWAAPTNADLMQRFANELVALEPDLILASTTPTTTALLQQTRTIPIVFAIVSDPVGSGCRLLAEPFRSRRSVLRSGGDPRTHPGHLRT